MSDHRPATEPHVHVHLHGLSEFFAHAVGLLTRILHKLDGMETKMSEMDDKIAALQASVAAENTIIDSAITLIQGIGAQIQAAVDAALAAGATPAELQAMSDLQVAVDTKAAALAAAIPVNTPTP